MKTIISLLTFLFVFASSVQSQGEVSITYVFDKDKDYAAITQSGSTFTKDGLTWKYSFDRPEGARIEKANNNTYAFSFGTATSSQSAVFRSITFETDNFPYQITKVEIGITSTRVDKGQQYAQVRLYLDDVWSFYQDISTDVTQRNNCSFPNLSSRSFQRLRLEVLPAQESVLLTSLTLYYNPQAIVLPLSRYGLSTVFYGDQSLQLPVGVVAQTLMLVDGRLTPTHTYYAGEKLPKGTAVMIKGDPSAVYTFNLVSNDAEAPTDNHLHGYDVAAPTQVSGSCYYYMLSTNQQNKDVGFYWGADNGGAFQSQAHRAFLAIPQHVTNARGFSLDMITLDVASAAPTERANPHAPFYTLSGLRLKGDPIQAGVYIRNGKKFVKR